MKSPFAALRRLHDWEVREHQRLLSKLRQQQQALRAAIAALGDEVKGEQRFAAEHPLGAGISLAAYARAAAVRRADLEKRLAELKAADDQQQDILQAAYGELKRAEILGERARAEAARKREDEAAKELDDLSAARRSTRGAAA
jgi:flagellar export protein FliJ